MKTNCCILPGTILYYLVLYVVCNAKIVRLRVPVAYMYMNNSNLQYTLLYLKHIINIFEYTYTLHSSLSN